MSYYMILVDSQGVPQKLIGPVEWDHAVDLVLEELAANKIAYRNFDKISEYERQQVQETGNCKFADGGGAYIRKTPTSVFDKFMGD